MLGEVIGDGSKVDEAMERLRAYKCCHELWEVDPKLVDAAFYDTYIGQVGNPNTYALYWKAKRYKKLLEHDTEVNKQNLLEKVNEMLERDVQDHDDLNIELFRNKFTKSYKMLIEGQVLLDQLCDHLGDAYREELNAQGKIELTADRMTKNMSAYFYHVDEEWYNDIVELFGLREHYRDRSGLLDAPKKQTWFVKHILSVVFGIELDVMNRDGKDKCKKNRLYVVNGQSWKNMIDKYKLHVFDSRSLPSFSFVPEPDEIDR